MYFRLDKVPFVSAVPRLAVLPSRCSVAWAAVSRWQHSVILARLAPDREVRVHRAPLAARAQQIQHSAEHLVQLHFAWGRLLARALQQ